MGDLQQGQWRGDRDFPHDRTGHFVRPDSPFRNWVTADGAPGPTGAGGFQGASRALSSDRLARLPVGAPHADLPQAQGARGHDLALGRPLAARRARLDVRRRARRHPRSDLRLERLSQFYLKARPDFSGRVTVPVLWDRRRADRQQRIVRDHPHVQRRLRRLGAAEGDYYPADSAAEIDALNARIYATVNNGVYRAGFATTQEAYEEAFRALFETLDWLEARLGDQRFLCGERLTEADWRLFTTLIRFDPVYFGHFKCNLRGIRDYPALQRYLRELYHWPGVAETVDFFHIKHHYYESHRRINPTGIVPLGPEMAL